MLASVNLAMSLLEGTPTAPRQTVLNIALAVAQMRNTLKVSIIERFGGGVCGWNRRFVVPLTVAFILTYPSWIDCCIWLDWAAFLLVVQLSC